MREIALAKQTISDSLIQRAKNYCQLAAGNRIVFQGIFGFGIK
jgi:hypothetical protein